MEINLVKIPVIRETKNILIYGSISFFIISFILSIYLLDLDLVDDIIFASVIAIVSTLFFIIFLYFGGIILFLRMALFFAKYGKNEKNAYITIFIPVALFGLNIFRIDYLVSLIQTKKYFLFVIVFGFLFEVVCPIINYFTFKKIVTKYKLNFAKQ